MIKKMGIWIDHKEAIIVGLTGKWKIIERILSQTEKQPQRSGDSPLKGTYESFKVPSDNRRQRSFTSHLNIFYDEVITYIRHANSILILGPGEAKNELKIRLAEKKFKNHIVGIETVDSMTDNQIVAKIRKHFFMPRTGL